MTGNEIRVPTKVAGGGGTGTGTSARGTDNSGATVEIEVDSDTRKMDQQIAIQLLTTR